MKKTLLSICFLSVSSILIASEATAQKRNASHWYNNLYARADAGISLPANKFKTSPDSIYPNDKKLKNGAVYNLGFGYNITDMFRSDICFSYRSLNYKAHNNDADIFAKQKIRSYSALINGYWDLNITKIVVPYLMAGVGYSYNRGSTVVSTGLLPNTSPGKKTSNFAWNIGLGSRFIVNDRFNLDLSYRYIDLGKTGAKNATTITNPATVGRTQRLKTNEIMGGVVIYM